MTTFCSDCDYVVEDSRKLPPWSWLCTKHPNIWDGFGYVTKDVWDRASPYLKCKDVNGGACVLFEARKEKE